MNPALVCFAINEEATAFRRRLGDRPGVRVLVTGMGRSNARRSLEAALQCEHPGQVFTCGFAGGLDPALRIGEVVFSTSELAIAKKLLLAAAKPATFHCANRVASTAAEKTELRRTTGADAVEMESEIIHLLCRKHGIPCTTVRVISDAAAEDLPLDFNRLSKPDLNLNYGKLVLAIARSPQVIPRLIQLRRQTRVAAENLAQVLIKVV